MAPEKKASPRLLRYQQPSGPARVIESGELSPCMVWTLSEPRRCLLLPRIINGVEF